MSRKNDQMTEEFSREITSSEEGQRSQIFIPLLVMVIVNGLGQIFLLRYSKYSSTTMFYDLVGMWHKNGREQWLGIFFALLLITLFFTLAFTIFGLWRRSRARLPERYRLK